MSAEIRVDRIKSRSGINTFSFTETGISYGYHVGFGTTSPRANVDVEGNLIVTGGNAGIGTTVSTSRLNVIGDVRVSGVVTATSFVGDGTNLTNTGSTLSAASGSQRVVLTGQTSGTMTASATDAALTFIQSTGTLNATNLVVTGNVSVAGTVTSMDVTNIDSVGIITAQQGLQVLANGINVTGVSTLSGGVNASQGIDATGLRVTGITTLGQANITGLSNAGVSTLGNATASTLNVSGVSTVGIVTGATSIQATDFYGSGANLTGIAATSNISTNAIVNSGMTTATGGIQVGVTTSLTVGDTFIRRGAVGLGTTSTTGRNAGVGTATGTIIFNSTENAVQVYNGNAWVDIRDTGTGIKATGGAIISGGGRTAHIFYSTGTFTVTNSLLTSVDYLVVAGGGGGPGGPSGASSSGGGGAGGFRTGTGFPVSSSPGVYPITVGGGGNHTSNGSDSTFSSITSTGGGVGSGSGNGSAGGSGGGSCGAGNGQSFSGGTGNSPPVSPPQGFDGGGSSGVGPTQYYAAGGGGGAGAVGTTSPPSSPATGAAGGAGRVSAVSGLPGFYAGGGGGGNGARLSFATSGGVGGAGGGGDGGVNGAFGTNGAPGSGGGAGGTGSPNPGGTGASGGSGVIIIAYSS